MNFLSKHTSNTINMILNLIKVKFKRILIIKPGFNYTDSAYFHNKNYKTVNVRQLLNEKSKYDLIIFNFSLQIELAVDRDLYISKLYELLSKDGLLLFNLLNNRSFRTFKKLFIEVDEFYLKGAYNRFGPFFDAQEIILSLQNFKFTEIVASNDSLEINYKSLKSLRSDLKSIGTANFNLPRPKFNKNIFMKMLDIFSS